jgi:hypothetical protein
MQGYIKDHRQELQSDIWQMPPLYHRLWQWLKYKVNHDDAEIPMTDGSKLLIKRGQHLTSIRKIANGIGWYERGLWKEPNPKTVTEMLNWMKNAQMLVVENGNSKYTLVTLINWDVFQINENESNAKVTVSKQSLGTNKNDKNEKKKDIKQTYAEFVTLTEKEYQTLVEQHGEDNALKMIAVLDNYKGSNGKKYASDYRAILNWVVERVMGKQPVKASDKAISSRNKDVDFQRWVEEGKDPDEFDWR